MTIFTAKCKKIIRPGLSKLDGIMRAERVGPTLAY